MAKAETTTRTLLESVILHLNEDEANVLRDILKYVSGCPTMSRRYSANAIADALDDQGVRGTNRYDICAKSSIKFV